MTSNGIDMPSSVQVEEDVEMTISFVSDIIFTDLWETILKLKSRNEINGETNEDFKPRVYEKDAIELKINTSSDQSYFQSLKEEELEVLKEHVDNNPLKRGVNCTACNKPISLQVADTTNAILRHPLLAVATCKSCYDFYNHSKIWKKDENGSDVYCRWCAQGGELLLCDRCPAAFCTNCLKRNLGRKSVSEILESDEWSCVICQPDLILNQKAHYYSIYSNQRSNFVSHGSTVDVTISSNNDANDKDSSSEDESEDTFIGKNIMNAFKALSDYKQCLKKERDSMKRFSRRMDANTAAKISKSLRKLYANTKKSLSALDKSVNQSFVHQFPKEKKRQRTQEEKFPSKAIISDVETKKPKLDMDEKPKCQPVAIEPDKILSEEEKNSKIILPSSSDSIKHGLDANIQSTIQPKLNDPKINGNEIVEADSDIEVIAGDNKLTNKEDQEISSVASKTLESAHCFRAWDQSA